MKNGLLSSLTVLSLLCASLNLEARDQKTTVDTPHKMQVVSGGIDQPAPTKAKPKPAEKSKSPAKKSGSASTGTSSSAPSTASSNKASTTKSKANTKNTKSGSKNAKDAKPKYVSPFPGQYPEASERLLKEEDVEHLTPWGMKVMLNEIYARQGFIFKEADLKKHFSEQSWYKGKQSSMSKIKLTAIEKKNITFIKAHQGKAKV